MSGDAPRSREPAPQPDRIAAQALTLGASVGLVVAMTLFDPPAWIGFVPPALVATVGTGPMVVALNVVLFVPLGATLGGWWPTRPRLLWWAVGLSVTVELLQLRLEDRFTDPRDVLANSVGALVGYAAARWADRRIRARRERRAQEC